MRKTRIILCGILLTLSLLTACAGQNAPAGQTGATDAAATQAPTDAPYIDVQPDEPEWTLYEGELKLEDKKNIYAENADILYFAIVTMDDGKQELRFQLDDETAEMLSKQSAENAYYMTLNGEKIGSATLSEDCSVVIITADNAAGEITALASRIRGLKE